MAARAPKTLIYLAHDNLNLTKGALRSANPDEFEVLFVQSERMINSARWHRQRLFFMLSAAHHFARELTGLGYQVHYLRAPDTASGIESAKSDYGRVIAAEPSSFRLRQSLSDIGVEFVPNDFFLTPRALFKEWASNQKSLKMENFYRWQRIRLDILMAGDEPVGGRWNFDEDNRLPPPKEPYEWPAYPKHERDEIDLQVMAEIENYDLVGQLSETTWGTTRQAALDRLDNFLHDSFEDFGPYEDAMTNRSWSLHHSLLAPYLNVGLITADEVIERAIERFNAGRIPLASCEGFVRQIIGWREYVNGIYWQFGPEYRESNVFSSKRALLPLFENPTKTKMKCVSAAVSDIDQRAWTHHIPRLMVLSNLATLADVDPAEFLAWMRRSFIDAADWVMVPNVIGMSMHADGGRMATKPYIAGGSYISRMSDYCKGCEYDPKTRTAEDSCPFTTLYWHFLDRHSERFRKNHRMFQQLAGLKKLTDLEETRRRGDEVMQGLIEGEI
jgi:deoxyribodipyrimidine photolyase-related protein